MNGPPVKTKQAGDFGATSLKKTFAPDKTKCEAAIYFGQAERELFGSRLSDECSGD